jgi:hypothetical protein
MKTTKAESNISPSTAQAIRKELENDDSVAKKIDRIVHAPKPRIYKGGWPEDELESMLTCMPISAILRALATVMIDNPYWETYDPRIIDTLDSVAKKIDRELENSDD